jgi:Recombination endonuclease VII.
MNLREKQWRENNRERVNANKRAWRAKNPEKSNACSKRWRKKNPVKCLALRRKQKYGLSQEGFDRLLESQNNGCASCRKTFVGGNAFLVPHVDHDHKTGKVRGLLCRGCNIALGLLNESPENLRGLLEYLVRNLGEN